MQITVYLHRGPEPNFLLRVFEQFLMQVGTIKQPFHKIDSLGLVGKYGFQARALPPCYEEAPLHLWPLEFANLCVVLLLEAPANTKNMLSKTSPSVIFITPNFYLLQDYIEHEYE